MPADRRLPVIIILLVLFSLAGLAWPTGEKTKESLIYDPLDLQQPPWYKSALSGNELWEKGDETGALREWEKAISLGYKDGLAFYYLGRYYARLEDWDKTISYLRRAKPMIIDKDREELLEKLYETLAGAYMKDHRYYESYIHYRKGLNLNPDSSSIHLGLANLNLLWGNLDEAETEARLVLTRSPNIARAYWIIATVAEKRNEYSVAAEFYQKFLNLEPDRWEARLSLGLLLHYRMKQSDQAEKELIKVIDLAPEDGRAHAVLAEISLNRGDQMSAAKAVERSLEYDPGNYQALVLQGRISLDQGKNDQAERYLREALKSDPNGALALYWMGVVLSEKENYREAETFFKRAYDLAPGLHEAAVNRGLILEKMGKKTEALRQLTEVVAHSPDFALGQLTLGRLYYYAGETDKAFSHFRNAMALDRSLWEPFYFIGRCFHDRGENRKALDFYLSAQKLENNNPQLITDLAVAYEDSDNPVLAEELLNKALELDPNYLRAVVRLGLLKARQEDIEGADKIYHKAMIIRPGNISWGNQEEERDFLVRLVSDVENYLGAGINYLSLYEVLKNISRDEKVFSDLIPVLKEKILLQPLKPEYPHLLGMAYQEKGDEENAEKYYLRSIRNDSDFVAAHLSLGQLYAGRKEYELARKHLKAVLFLAPDSTFSPVVKELVDSFPE